MYHNILPDSDNKLTVTIDKLEQQFKYLTQKSYNTLFFSKLKENKALQKKIILTFDDGYKNNQEYLLPLLKKYNLKATIFLPTGRIGVDDDKMTFSELKELDTNHIELALHSHDHPDYTKMSEKEIEQDLIKNITCLEKNKIPFTKVLAYPYGKYKKKDPDFFKTIEKCGIDLALRIGNKIESYPFRNKYEVNRIGIKGGDTMLKFKLRLFFGKLKF
ncbi:MAG: polysaccharide deacetylase family protein [Flavobacteriales bacterium]